MALSIRFAVVVLATPLVMLSPGRVAAQVGVVDDVLRVASKAGRAAKLTQAGRIATNVTDDAGRILKHMPASAATRQAFGVGLTVAAGDAFQAGPRAASRLRMYVGLSDSDLRYVPDTNTSPPGGTVLHSADVDEYVDRLRASGEQLSGLDYFVEADVLDRSRPRFGSTDRVFLANYGDRPWPVRSVGDHVFAAEVNRSLWLKVSEGTVSDVKHLLDLAFDPEDIRIGSMFDPQADGESVDALRRAAAGARFTNLESPGDVLAFVGEKRGTIVALVGHVEDQHFVVPGVTGEKFRIEIASLIDTAERRGVSLLLLGCDTAVIPAGGGVAGRINSVAIASQLQAALTARTYGDFLSALGSPANPLVLSREVLGRASLIVGERLRREVRGERAGVVSAMASPRLAQLQNQNAAQTFRSLPRWLDQLIVGAAGLLSWVFVIALVVSLFKGSLSPVKRTAAVLLGVVLLPYVALKWMFEPR